MRSFGCGVVVGGYDRYGPQLYMAEPSGVSYYFGAAIGKGRLAAKTLLDSLEIPTYRTSVDKIEKLTKPSFCAPQMLPELDKISD
ncbi:hypothetical protein GIB67_010466 [Kingdonia uniflora]|uniref:Uncharacterized protein n=1 Tax=Kingdonia uniflora TaxID=39325 RepID=A0A7J7MAN5_9MAGN|nr:hypothetical protein GIB67_010466 [Kingdonia uniflora]